MENKEPENPLKIEVTEYSGSYYTRAVASFGPDGRFELNVLDAGDSVKSFCGRDETEWCLTVRPENKDRLLLVLLDHAFHGNPSVLSELKDLLKEKSVPHEFESVW
jgi:hypothetical protein